MNSFEGIGKEKYGEEARKKKAGDFLEGLLYAYAGSDINLHDITFLLHLTDHIPFDYDNYDDAWYQLTGILWNGLNTGRYEMSPDKSLSITGHRLSDTKDFLFGMVYAIPGITKDEIFEEVVPLVRICHYLPKTYDMPKSEAFLEGMIDSGALILTQGGGLKVPDGYDMIDHIWNGRM